MYVNVSSKWSLNTTVESNINASAVLWKAHETSDLRFQRSSAQFSAPLRSSRGRHVASERHFHFPRRKIILFVRSYRTCPLVLLHRLVCSFPGHCRVRLHVVLVRIKRCNLLNYHYIISPGAARHVNAAVVQRFGCDGRLQQQDPGERWSFNNNRKGSLILKLTFSNGCLKILGHAGLVV